MLYNFFKDKFVLFTSVLSVILSALYVWKGFQLGFNTLAYIIIIVNFLYMPLALLFGKKLFPIFYFIYSAIIIFGIAFDKTYLFNNYTGLFIVSIVVMLKPKLRKIALIFYFVVVSIAFCLNEERIYHYFIHIVRSLWFIGIVEYVLNDKFRRKKLVLYEDERDILEQLSNGMVYQKEVVGFSENTIYRKLKAARERNGNLTREELVNQFRKEKEEFQSENSK